jgi:uncharacterized protein
MSSGTEDARRADLRRHAVRFLLIFFSVWIVRVVIYKYFDQRLESQLLKAGFSLLWKTAVWIGLPLFYLVRVEKQPAAAYLRLRPVSRNTASWCLAVLAVAAAWQSALWAFGMDTHFPGLRQVVLAVWGAGVCEEVLFRGYLLRRFNEFMGFVPAMVITSALFVGAHVPGWLIFMDYSLRDVASNGLYVFGISIVLSLLVRKSRSLYPSILFHSCADIIAM